MGTLTGEETVLQFFIRSSIPFQWRHLPQENQVFAELRTEAGTNLQGAWKETPINTFFNFIGYNFTRCVKRNFHHRWVWSSTWLQSTGLEFQKYLVLSVESMSNTLTCIWRWNWVTIISIVMCLLSWLKGATRQGGQTRAYQVQHRGVRHPGEH